MLAPAGDMALLYEDGFESATASRWEPSDASAWRVKSIGGNNVYSLFKDCSYEPPVRAPQNFALLKDLEVKSFVLEVKVQSTEPEYGHRDVCLFFGYNDPSHLYYVHFATKADDHANSIFVVDGKPRVSIASQRTSGTHWDEQWHTVRVERDVVTGMIKTYFDDMTTPVMLAMDKTFLRGRIGIGSFDDTANFDDLRVWGERF